MRRPQRPPLRHSVVVTLASFASVLACGAVFDVSVQGWPHEYDTELQAACATLLFFVSVFAAGRFARSRGSHHVLAAMGSGIAAGAITASLAIAFALHDAVTKPFMFLRPLPPIADIPAIALASIVAAACTFLAHRFQPLDPVARRNRLRATRTLVSGTIVIGIALLAAASWRARRAPPLSAYLRSLPVVAEAIPRQTPVDPRHPIDPRTIDTLHPIDPAQTIAYLDDRLGPYAVRRYWLDTSHCAPRLAHDASELPRRIPRNAEGIFCESLVLRADARHGWLLLHSMHTRYDAGPMAYDARTLAPIPAGSLVDADIARDAAMPRGWIRVAAALLGIAIVSMVLGSDARRRLLARDTWRTGSIDPRGVITFDDGTSPMTLERSPGIGRVVVFDLPGALGAGPFRDRDRRVAASEGVRLGDPDAVETALLDALASRAACGLAFATAAVGVLGAAAAVRLVF